jgi:hypothetical protein
MSAKTYYRDSVDETKLPYRYIYLGKDGAGRRLYQRQLDGEDYGRPSALLTYAEGTQTSAFDGRVTT